MQKTVKQIAELVSEISSKYEVMEDTALNILAAAAGGFDNIAYWIKENGDKCCCHDDDEDGWDDEEDVVTSEEVCVGTKNRVTIPRSIIEEAERVNGECGNWSKIDGEFTVVRGEATVTIYFGDRTDDYADDCDETVTINHPNANNALQFSVAPTFKTGQVLSCAVLGDGRIVLD